MLISQETAQLIDTLATAAAKIGSTPASDKINRLIVAMLPDTAECESIAEALRQDNAGLEDKLAIASSNLMGMRSILQVMTKATNESSLNIQTYIEEIDSAITATLSMIDE